MIKISQNGARAVAGDVRHMLTSLDLTYLSAARLSLTAIEAAQESELPARQTQEVLREMHTSTGLVLDARGRMIKAMDRMLVIKGKSDQAETDLGCVPGMPMTGDPAFMQDRSPASV